MGGGVTPVHTTLVPDITTIVKNGLQENMNPSLNAMSGTSPGNGIGPNRTFVGFDGFSDLNPFTMKTLAAYESFCLFLCPLSLNSRNSYRMHLWGKMAAQQQMHQQNQVLQNHQNLSGLASNLRPHFFSTSPKPNMPPSTGYGSTLSALLSRSTMFPIQIHHQPRPRHTLHRRPFPFFIRNHPGFRLLLPIHHLRCRRLRKNNSMLYWRPWLAKPSSANWAMRFGMCLLDLPPTPLPLLVVIGMLIKYVKFWKAKLCYVLSMWSLLLFRRRLLCRYQVHLPLHHLHHPNGRVSHRGLHWVIRDPQWHPHHRCHRICQLPQRMVVGCPSRVSVKWQYVTFWRRA
jgi:hypothetical protein